MCRPHRSGRWTQADALKEQFDIAEASTIVSGPTAMHDERQTVDVAVVDDIHSALSAQLSSASYLTDMAANGPSSPISCSVPSSSLAPALSTIYTTCSSPADPSSASPWAASGVFPPRPPSRTFPSSFAGLGSGISPAGLRRRLSHRRHHQPLLRTQNLLALSLLDCGRIQHLCRLHPCPHARERVLPQRPGGRASPDRGGWCTAHEQDSCLPPQDEVDAQEVLKLCVYAVLLMTGERSLS
jgi:hypothetical protein